MASKSCDGSQKLWVWGVLLRDECAGEDKYVKFCCLRDLRITATTEGTVDQKEWPWQCQILKLGELKYNIEFDSFGDLSADAVEIALPNTVKKQYDETVEEEEFVNKTAGDWCVDSAIEIPYGNFDGTLPTIVVTGSVDGVLTEGTGYTVTQSEDCIYKDGTFKGNFVTITAPTIEEQDISISVKFFPVTGVSLELAPGNFVYKQLDVIIHAVNKFNTAETQNWRAKIYFNYNGDVFKYHDWQGDLDPNAFTLEVVENSVIKWLNVTESSTCDDGCA